MDTKKEINEFNPTLKINQASMPPASWYTHSQFLELENQNIFRGTWQPVARVSQLQGPNSYISGVTAGVPWVITKSKEGEIKAFYNVCSHKGREVVKGSGLLTAGRLVCGYHAWSFNSEGELVNTPGATGFEDFHKCKMNLKPLNLDTWGHWIFINTDLKAKPVLSQLPDLTEKLEARSWTALKFNSSKEWTIKCNWKVFVDNYLDGGYHIPFMHPSLNDQIDMSSYQTTLYDTYNIQGSPVKLADSKKLNYDHKKRIGEGSVYAWIFPNFMINVYGNCMDINYLLPVDKDTCHVYYEFYFSESEDKDFIKKSIEQADVTQIEDIEICESVQLGLNSGAYTPGRYAPNLEVGEYQFHQMLHEWYLG